MKIREQGYTRSASLVRKYITEWKKKYKKNPTVTQVAKRDQNIISIKRSTIIKMLFSSSTKIKEIDTSIWDLISKQYPVIEQVLTIVFSFKNIISNKEAIALKSWISEVKKTNISELISFTKGLEHDYDAVMNSIQLSYNNGLAEGKVNKLKVIKRIMYGRCGFNTLRNKVYILPKPFIKK